MSAEIKRVTDQELNDQSFQEKLLKRYSPEIANKFDPYRDDVKKIATAGFSLLLNGTFFGTEHFECTYPVKWQLIYQKRLYITYDPILKFASRANGGDSRWSELDMLGSKAFMKSARAYGLVYGAVFARRVASGVSLLSTARTDRELEDREIETLSDIATSFFAEIGERSPLTPKHIEVIQCLANGLNVEQAAHQLGLTESAVKTRLKKARDLTGVPTNTGLAVYCTKKFLVT